MTNDKLADEIEAMRPRYVDAVVGNKVEYDATSIDELFQKIISALRAERPQSGEMVMVPREPTKKMLDGAIAGQSFPQDFGRDYQGRALNEAARIYRAMLAACEEKK